MPERDLLRGKALGLPNGQAVARAMGLPKRLIVPEEALQFKGKPGAVFAGRTPLWSYILREADYFASGKQLGPVGGRIVAEVLLGLLEGDPGSYLRVQPRWHPVPGGPGALPDADPHDFSTVDLLRYVEAPA